MQPLRWIAAAMLLLASVSAHANGPPVWQPYRRTMPQHVPTTHVPSYSMVHDMPVEAISDAYLDRLAKDCCADPFEESDYEYASDSPFPFGDPVLAPMQNANQWTFELLPNDLIWRSYWAGAHEPRISAALFEETSGQMTLLDVALGGRSAVMRYGAIVNGRPEGVELQFEGAALLRLNLDENWDFEAADFRFGVPLVYGRGPLEWKVAYYHLSSHLGDEFIIRTGSTAPRINYARDELVFGVAYYPLAALRCYAETGWAFYADEGADPWEVQFGFDYARPGPTGSQGTPFVAVNGHLREEVDFGGNLVVQAGWLWRGTSGRVLRTGLHYYNGKSSQFEFFNQFEQQIGVGLWHEF